MALQKPNTSSSLRNKAKKKVKAPSKGSSFGAYGEEISEKKKPEKESIGIVNPLPKEVEQPVPNFSYIASYARIPGLRKKSITGD